MMKSKEDKTDAERKKAAERRLFWWEDFVYACLR